MGAPPAGHSDGQRGFALGCGAQPRRDVRIVAVLLDTNILVRLANSADAAHAIATRSVFELRRRGEPFHIAAQNLVGFRSVATRPLASNGLGLSAVEAQAKSDAF